MFSWSFGKTFKRWKMIHQTSPSMMLSAPFAGMEEMQVDGSWSGFAGDLFIKVVLLDHTAESAKDVILNNATSLDTTLAEERYKQNLHKLEMVPSIRRYGEQRRVTWSKAEIECRLQAMAVQWSALRGFFFFCTLAMESQTADFLSRTVAASITVSTHTQRHLVS